MSPKRFNRKKDKIIRTGLKALKKAKDLNIEIPLINAIEILLSAKKITPGRRATTEITSLLLSKKTSNKSEIK